MSKKSVALSGLILAASAGCAIAHPHVWVTMQTSIATNPQGLVTGVDVEWTFDDAFAQVALDGMDKDHDGIYSADELEPLAAENLSSLRDYDYFMHFKVDGELQKVPDATNGGVVWAENKLTLHFTAPLPVPVDPRQHKFEVKIFDPEFYIAFDYAKDTPVDSAGDLPPGCTIDIKPVPTTAELEQTRAMLATKGKEWKPDPNDEFGAMFAQPVSVLCKGT